MADAETWSTRIAEWRASGLTAPDFCAGRDFTAGSLYFWSSRLGRRNGPSASQDVQLARVIRRRDDPPVREAPSDPDVPLVLIELAGLRVFVAPGVDRATLETVLGAVHSTTAGAVR